MDTPPRCQFDSVDHTRDPVDFVRYLDTTGALDFFQQVKQRILGMMDLRAGERVADMGCGTGDDVRALAACVGPSGSVVGVDLSSTMIETARLRLGEPQKGIEFVQADVQNLAFTDASFDAIRAERLLQHIPDAGAALREIVRVAKPGGRIVIWEGDLDLFIIDAPDHEISRFMQRFICDSFRNGAIGHQLYRRFIESGLVDVRAIPLVGQFADLGLIENAFDLTASVERAIAQNLIESGRAQRWLESLRSASSAGRFFTAIGGFVVYGRKS
jgi:ubiquinone/menaquinone biosynthesis C-methylase UbiE